jgi:uncharacterized protein
MLQTLRCPFFLKALGLSAPIGVLAGLIGLGGGEFRLPVLMHVIGFSAKASVPINLIVSFITLLFALAIRGNSVPSASMAPHLPEIVGLLAGGTASAYWGVHLVRVLNNERLVEFIAILLAAIGLMLLIEVAFPFQAIQLSSDWPTHLVIGFAIGAVVGVVSSLLGVAGGELLIPSLMFVFDTDIRTAGTASIVISLAIVAVGIWRYHRMNAVPKGRGVHRIALSMSVGSMAGAMVGGLMVGIAPVSALKIILGFVLMAAAGKTFMKAPLRNG